MRRARRTTGIGALSNAADWRLPGGRAAPLIVGLRFGRYSYGVTDGAFDPLVRSHHVKSVTLPGPRFLASVPPPLLRLPRNLLASGFGAPSERSCYSRFVCRTRSLRLRVRPGARSVRFCVCDKLSFRLSPSALRHSPCYPLPVGPLISSEQIC